MKYEIGLSALRQVVTTEVEAPESLLQPTVSAGL